MSETESSLLKCKLNLETAKINWSELQRFFAQGKVLVANQSTDLVSIAELCANNQSDQITMLINKQTISQVNDDQAKKWIENDSQVWAVVVAPWVLVQEAD